MHANGSATVRTAEGVMRHSLLRNAAQLQKALPTLISSVAIHSDTPQRPLIVHPALAIPFSQLVSRIAAAEAEGLVERNCIPSTSLYVLNSTVGPMGEGGSLDSMILALCRGLVISSDAVVAAPFCRFDHHDVLTLIDPDEMVQATEKLDGSLIIAFMWEGRIVTCTKRRADSEQSMWARAWLQKQGLTDRMVAGDTYLFEAVYHESAVVCEYLRDECVLIAMRDSSGVEAEYKELVMEAKRLGVPIVKMIHGRASEFIAEASAAADLSSEGWVLKTTHVSN
eukprot:7004233-Prymnesium_polylepis.1